MSLLVAHHLVKQFGEVRAVADVDLSVDRGETVAIIGPNGAGKSTLFGLIAGEHTPTSGTIHIDERNVTGWKASKLARGGVSRTFQVARQFGTRTVRDNLLIASAASRGVYMRPWNVFGTDPDDHARVEDIIEKLDFVRFYGTTANELSHGNRKRLELAMALVQQPSLLLLDEPTAGMAIEDVPPTIQLLAEVRAVRPDLAILITAHDMEVVFSLADRVALLAEGRKRIEGTPQEIENDPVTREIYLGSDVR